MSILIPIFLFLIFLIIFLKVQEYFKEKRGTLITSTSEESQNTKKSLIPQIKITTSKVAIWLFYLMVILVSLLIIAMIIAILVNTFSNDVEKGGFSTNITGVDGGCFPGDRCRFDSSTGGTVEISTTTGFENQWADISCNITGENFSSEFVFYTGFEKTKPKEGPSSENGMDSFNTRMFCPKGTDCQGIITIYLDEGGYVDIEDLNFIIY